MKVGRRAFMGFVAGGIAGTLLSPLPWKLTDDVAIWTQNWSWRPSPEKGHRAGMRTLCTMCGAACSVEVDLINRERAIYVRGSDINPLNKGGVCALGESAVQFVYAPYRIQQPMKQTKQRGDRTGFQPISWKDALGELAKKLNDLRTRGNAHQVACLTGRKYTTTYDLWKQFFRAYGSPNVFTMPHESDGHPAVAYAIFGTDSPFAFDIENASGILSFGAEWADGWGPCAHLGRVFARWLEERPGKAPTAVIQVSSRLSMSATKAQEWIAVKPGTEAALALGIAHIIIRENRVFQGIKEYEGYDRWFNFEGESQPGFRDFVMKEYPPERVAGITGLSVSKIEEITRWLTSQPKPLVIWGSGGSGSPEFFYHELAYVALNMLLGNFEDKGMCSFTSIAPRMSMPESYVEPVAPRLDVSAGTSGIFRDMINSLYPFLNAVSLKKGYPIDVLFVDEANPLYSLANSEMVEQACAQVKTIVALTSFMDETAIQADIILPVPVMLERWNDVSALPGIPFTIYGISSPVIKTRYNLKHSGDIILQLALILGNPVDMALPWKKYEDVLKARLQAIADTGRGAVSDVNTDFALLVSDSSIRKNYRGSSDLFKKLKEGAIWYDTPRRASEFVTTETGRPRFISSFLEREGITTEKLEFFMPHFTTADAGKNTKDYPLLLVGYTVSHLSSTTLPNAPLMMKNIWDFNLIHRDGFVEINPKTALELGFSEGSEALLRTSHGEARVRVHLTKTVPPGMVTMVKGLGHRAYDEYVANRGVRVVALTEVQIDPVTALGVEKGTRAQLAHV